MIESLIEYKPDTSINGIHGQRHKCNFCGQTHVAATQAALYAMIEKCRKEWCGYMMNREFIRKEDLRGGAAV